MTMKFKNFAWYDLMTDDTEAAASFYGKVVGWKTESVGSAEHPYSTFSIGSQGVAGLMPIPPEACEKGMRPCWRGYILVDDVDAYTNRVKAAGGSVHREPQDIPGTIRFSVVADPHGAVFILFKGMGEPPAEELAPDAPGNIGWRELYAGEWQSAFAFYSDLFGWTKDRFLDMGEMGIYQTFASDGVQIGGMMTKTPEIPEPYWLFYFNVDAVDAAMTRVTEGGGKVLMGPHQVPTGSWIVQCMDPQGAPFAIVSPKR